MARRNRGFPLLAVDAPALPRARRQSGIGGDLATVVERTEQRLEPEQRGQLRPDPPQAGKGGWRSARVTLCGFCHKGVALAFDRGQLRDNHLQAVELAVNLRLEPLRQGATIPGLERVQVRPSVPVLG